jgi:hypothetical protein
MPRLILNLKAKMPLRRLVRVRAVGLPSHRIKWFVPDADEGDCGGASCGGFGDPALASF